LAAQTAPEVAPDQRLVVHSQDQVCGAARHRHARHRHVDWIGACGKPKIVSAPSSVMSGTNKAPTYFLIHTLTTGPGGQVGMLAPERVDIAA
jgi:hypothetical protein